MHLASFGAVLATNGSWCVIPWAAGQILRIAGKLKRVSAGRLTTEF